MKDRISGFCLNIALSVYKRHKLIPRIGIDEEKREELKAVISEVRSARRNLGQPQNIVWPELIGTYQGTASAEGYHFSDGTPLKLSEKDQKLECLRRN